LSALGGDLADAGFDGLDLRGGARLAVLPVGALGEDRLHAAIGKLGLARQRLRLGADLGGKSAMALDVGADGGKPGLGLLARRQFGKCGSCTLMSAIGLGEVGVEAVARLRQCRLARGMTVQFALSRGVALARGIGFVLGVAPTVTRG